MKSSVVSYLLLALSSVSAKCHVGMTSEAFFDPGCTEAIEASQKVFTEE